MAGSTFFDLLLTGLSIIQRDACYVRNPCVYVGESTFDVLQVLKYSEKRGGRVYEKEARFKRVIRAGAVHKGYILFCEPP